jgi:D-alanine transaminase
MPLADARISPFDRSFLFGDGVYEVLRVYGGKLFRPEAHLNRLDRSAAAIRLKNPHPHAGWMVLLNELVAANGGGDQYIYLQLSRGAEWGRNHAPLPDIPPTVFAYSSPWPQVAESTLRDGLACITAQDTRWARCDIKSVALLANVLLRQLAVDANASETILLRDGELMEGSASTVHIVKDGVLVTPLNSTRILPSTTRGVVEELADNLGIIRRDARVSEAELRAADEIWLAAATREVQPVTALDGKPVGTGKPGPLWRRVYDAYQQLKRR